MEQSDAEYRSQVLASIQKVKKTLHDLERQVEESQDTASVANAIKCHTPTIFGNMYGLEGTVSSKADDIWSIMGDLLVLATANNPSYWEDFESNLDYLAKVPIFTEVVMTKVDPEENNNLLHMMCKSNPPPHIMESVLALTRDMELPSSSECIYEVTNVYMKTPLLLLVENNCSTNTIKLLLDEDSSKKTLTMTDSDGNTPLVALTKNFGQHQNASEILRLLVDTTNAQSRESLGVLPWEQAVAKIPLQTLWEYFKEEEHLSPEEAIHNEDFVFLIKSTCLAMEQNSAQDVPLLFAVLKCAPYLSDAMVEIVEEIIRSSTGSGMQALDNRGNNALHLLAQYDIFYGGGMVYSFNRRERLSRLKLELIECILEHDPGAAKSRNSEGDLPLHIALHGDGPIVHRCRGDNETDICTLLVKAYPDSIAVTDNQTGLYPFLLAAVGSCACLTTAYSLLRESPWLLPKVAGVDEDDSSADQMHIRKKQKYSY